MKLNVLEERENPVLKRKELVLNVDYEQGSTASKAALQKAVSEQLNANIENVEITKILSENGKTAGTAWVKIWQDKKIPLYKAKKAEAPKEEAKVEEKPAAEENKEEPKQAATDEHVEEVAPKEEPGEPKKAATDEHVEEVAPKQEGE